MATNIYFCSNCGKYILKDWDDYYDIVQETLKNEGTIEYDEYRYFEGSIMLYEKLTPNATGRSSCSKPFNHFTLNKELYDLVQKDDNYIYLSGEVMDENKKEKPYSYYGYCPCCGANLDHNERDFDALKAGFRSTCGQTFIKDKTKQFFETIDGMKNRRILYYNKKFQPNVDKHINEIKNSIQVDNVPTVSRSVNIKDYLLNLINVESTIYSLTKRYQDLLTIDEEFKNAANYIKENDKGKLMEQLVDKKLNTQKLVEELNAYFNVDEATVDLKKYGIYKPIEPMKPIEPSVTKPLPPTFEKAGLFNKSKVEKRNNELQKKYDEDLLRYNNAWDNYRNKLNDFNVQIQLYPGLLFQYEENVQLAIKKEKALRDNDVESKDKLNSKTVELNELESKFNNIDVALEIELSKHPIIASHNLCVQEMKVIDDTLLSAFETRSKLHNMGVVHSKYLDFVCVATMYDYFETGRCNSLVGANGAYNLYESETRMNLIIDKLDVVIDKLYMIQRNQYMLYNELKTANSHLEEISHATSKALKTLDAIAYNTAQTAFYSKVNAKLTDALGYLIAFK